MESIEEESSRNREILGLSQNLLVDLKTGKTRLKAKEDSYRRTIPWTYNSTTSTSRIVSIMEDLIGPDVESTQLLLGLCISGYSGRKIIALSGPGKMMFVDILRKFLGPLYYEALPDHYLMGLDAECLEFFRSRVSCTSCCIEGSRLDEDKLYLLTHGKTVLLSGIYPTSTNFILVEDDFTCSATAAKMIRRLYVKETILAFPLGEDIMQELLNWSVQGVMKYLRKLKH